MRSSSRPKQIAGKSIIDGERRSYRLGADRGCSKPCLTSERPPSSSSMRNTCSAFHAATARVGGSFPCVLHSGRDHPNDQLRGLDIAEALMCERPPSLEGDRVADGSPTQTAPARPTGVEDVGNSPRIRLDAGANSWRQSGEVAQQVGAHCLRRSIPAIQRGQRPREPIVRIGNRRPLISIGCRIRTSPFCAARLEERILVREVAVERGSRDASSLGDGAHRCRSRTNTSVKLNRGFGYRRPSPIHSVSPCA
jgi:hypothetical protein